MTTEAPTSAPESFGQGEGTTSAESLDWLGSIPEDLTYEEKGEDGKPVAKPLREHPKMKEFKDPGSLAKSYLELEKKLGGKALKPLPENASEEERAKFDKAYREVMGVPDNPEGYDMDLPPEWESTDAELTGWFKGMAHKIGMNNAQAKQFVEGFLNYSSSYWDKQGQKLEDAKKENATAVAAHFEKAGHKPEAAIDLARRGFVAAATKAGIPAEEAQAFSNTYGDNLTFLRLFHFLGSNMREDEIAAPGRKPGGGDGSLEGMYKNLFQNSKGE